MICDKCRKKIFYIATVQGTVIPCEVEETTIITERGREVVGHKKHICGDKEDAKKKK